MAWRLINLEECEGQTIDRVIALKFPSFVVAHPYKVTWLVHQYGRISFQDIGLKDPDVASWSEYFMQNGNQPAIQLYSYYLKGFLRQQSGQIS